MLLLLALSFLLSVKPVNAEERGENPSLSSDKWVSVDQFVPKMEKDDQEGKAEKDSPLKATAQTKAVLAPSKTEIAISPPVLKTPSQEETPSVDPSSSEAVVQKEETSSHEPPLAQPERALNLPVLPGARSSVLPSPPAEEENNSSDVSFFPSRAEGALPPLSPTKWQNLSSGDLLKEKAVGKNLSLRFAALPNPHIKPVERAPLARKYPQPPASAPEAKAAAAKKEKTAPSCSPKEMEALRSYKKQQLAAIESDRKTLKALQEAISDLGASKKLDFTSDGYSTLISPVSDQKTADSK